LDTIHHHHSLEETFYFSALEEKLGQGTLSGNVEQHKEFIPGLEALEEWCKRVQNGEAKYDDKVFLAMVEAFSDTMITHLNDVCAYYIYFFPYLTYTLLPIPLTIGNLDFGSRAH
jgi:hemerythrin-like domain-containing protein